MNIFAGNVGKSTILAVEEFESAGEGVGFVAAVELFNNDILHIGSITTLRVNEANENSVLILKGSLNIIDMCYVDSLIIVNKGDNNLLISNTDYNDGPIIKLLDKGTFKLDSKLNLTKIEDYVEYKIVSVKCTPDQLSSIENLGVEFV
jgi:hypothetical protein